MCGKSIAEPGNPVVPIKPVDLGVNFVWKDRWDTGVFANDQFHDGYAGGIADIIRHLDNAGKTASVLLDDISKASACTTNRGGPHTVGDLMKTVTPVVNSRKDDPLASTSGAVFDALIACERKKS